MEIYLKELIGSEFLLRPIKCKMILKNCLIFILFNCYFQSFAQLPQTAIYLLHIDNPSDTSWTLSKIDYLTSFNSAGYNNQPYFISPTDLLASVRPVNGDNNDIYEFDLVKKTFTNITSSTASEYSPRTSPYNSQQITCISVPKNDTSIQNLVEIKLQTGEYVKTIFNKFAKIGYYRYIRDQIWVCYLVEEPHVLSICDAGKLSKKIFASSIGRSFEVISPNEVLFVHKITNDRWLLKNYNVSTEKSKTLAVMPVGTEDFVLNENGTIFCANDSKVFKLTYDGHWQTLIDLMPLDIRNINRLAISKDQMAVVSVLKP
jgi:hypothetical protein